MAEKKVKETVESSLFPSGTKVELYFERDIVEDRERDLPPQADPAKGTSVTLTKDGDLEVSVPERELYAAYGEVNDRPVYQIVNLINPPASA